MQVVERRDAWRDDLHAEEVAVTVTFSAGVAAWTPGIGAELLLERADAALYAAKRAGRARTVCWSELPEGEKAPHRMP